MQRDWNAVGNYGTVGLELALSIAFGFFGGQWLDKKLGTHPWLSLIGLGFGTAAGFRSLFRTLERANREAEEHEKRARQERKKYHDDPDGTR